MVPVFYTECFPQAICSSRPGRPRFAASCTRFRMRRRKGSRGPSPCPRLSEYHPTIAKLQETVLELSNRLDRLYETVLQQTLVFRDHLSSCNAMMNDMTRLILATALIIAAFSPIQPYNSLFPLSPDPSIPCSHFGSCPDSPSPDDTSHATEPPEPSPSFCFRASVIIR